MIFAILGIWNQIARGRQVNSRELAQETVDA